MQIDKIEMAKRKMILRDYQKGLNRYKINENIVNKFGDCVGYGVRTLERWFKKFRNGDFDLTVIPRDRELYPNNKSYMRKTKKTKRKRGKQLSKKTVEVDQVTFKQEPNQELENGKATTVQNLLHKKRELTISKVSSGAAVRKPPVEQNVFTKPSLGISAKTTESTTKEPETPMETCDVPRKMPKLRPRRALPQRIDITLPDSVANRMDARILTESHSIGERSREGTKEHSTTLPATGAEKVPNPKEVTVEFQNMNPEIAKNTVRKKPDVINKRNTISYINTQHSTGDSSNITLPNIVNGAVGPPPTEVSGQVISNGISDTVGMLKIASVASINPEINKFPEVSNKRHTLPQLLPQIQQKKGVIYLNPQEIFPQNFNCYRNTIKPTNTYKPKSEEPPKMTVLTQKQPAFISPPATTKQDSVLLSDSDDDDEVLFPENASVPAPKNKTLPETFTTYFDLENSQPIIFDPSPKEKSPVSKPVESVIVID